MKFTEDHEWLREDGDVVVVGITEHASTQLGDVVTAYSQPGTQLDGDVRGKRMPAVVADLPFRPATFKR